MTTRAKWQRVGRIAACGVGIAGWWGFTPAVHAQTAAPAAVDAKADALLQKAAEQLRANNGLIADFETVTEYAVVLGVLIVGLASIVLVLKTGINTFLGKVSTALSNLLP